MANCRKEKGEIMILELELRGFFDFGVEDGGLKINAGRCILCYLKEGLKDVKGTVDLIICMDTSFPEAVLFHVLKGGNLADSVSFYYIVDFPPDIDEGISHTRIGSLITPQEFCEIIVPLAKVGV